MASLPRIAAKISGFATVPQGRVAMPSAPGMACLASKSHHATRIARNTLFMMLRKGSNSLQDTFSLLDVEDNPMDTSLPQFPLTWKEA